MAAGGLLQTRAQAVFDTWGGNVAEKPTFFSKPDSSKVQATSDHSTQHG